MTALTIARGYPIDAYHHLSALLPSMIYIHLTPLFALLARLAAHSHLSGLTPHSVSSLFSPFIFNIPTSTYITSHSAFTRASSATEHILLAYIRSSGQRDGVGIGDLPSRLKEWIRGYPRMIPSDGDLARGGPRRGARVVRCELVRRNVRAYSRDLISAVESWQIKWDVWDKVAGPKPVFSSGWKRRMRVKDIDKDEAWGSLAGKEWGIFEQGGFEVNEVASKLQFDLNGGAKNVGPLSCTSLSIDTRQS
jgi:hypothetical protein